jgi:hypothetical protein
LLQVCLTESAKATSVKRVDATYETTSETDPRESPPPDAREQLALTLMTYARENPDRIRGRLMPVIVYDPRAGHRAFRVMMEKLGEAPRPPSP